MNRHFAPIIITLARGVVFAAVFAATPPRAVGAPDKPAAPAAAPAPAPAPAKPAPLPLQDSAVWQQECGACHIAYPASLLGPASWNGVMSGLDKHFGTDASLDAATAAQVGRYLRGNAGREQAPATTATATPVLRISDTAWFRREHREVPAARWRSPGVKSAANCAACHRGAANGNFEEDERQEHERGERDND